MPTKVLQYVDAVADRLTYTLGLEQHAFSETYANGRKDGVGATLVARSMKQLGVLDGRNGPSCFPHSGPSCQPRGSVAPANQGGDRFCVVLYGRSLRSTSSFKHLQRL